MNELAGKAPAQHTMYPDASEMVNDYIRRFGEEVSAQLPPLDEKGHSAVRHGERIVGINVSGEHDVLMFLTEMVAGDAEDVPDFHRRALELNFLATGGCSLAIDPQTGTLYLRAMRSLPGLDYTEFRELLVSMVSVAEDLAPRLAAAP